MYIHFYNIIGGYKIHFLIELNLINVHSHVRAKQWVEKHSEAFFEEITSFIIFDCTTTLPCCGKIIKGGFFLESAFHFFHLQISKKKKYSKKLS